MFRSAVDIGSDGMSERSLINSYMDSYTNSDSTTRIFSFGSCLALTPTEKDYKERVAKIVQENKLLKQNLVGNSQLVDKLLEEVKVLKRNEELMKAQYGRPTEQQLLQGQDEIKRLLGKLSEDLRQVVSSREDTDSDDDYTTIDEVIEEVDGYCSVNYVNNTDTRSKMQRLQESLQRLSGQSNQSRHFENTNIPKTIEAISNQLDSLSIHYTYGQENRERDQILELKQKNETLQEKCQEYSEENERLKETEGNLKNLIFQKDEKIKSIERELDKSVEVMMPVNFKEVEDLKKSNKKLNEDLEIALNSLKKSDVDHKEKIQDMNKKVLDYQKENGELENKIRKMQENIKAKQKIQISDSDKINSLLEFKKNIKAVYDDVPENIKEIFLTKIREDDLDPRSIHRSGSLRSMSSASNIAETVLEDRLISQNASFTEEQDNNQSFNTDDCSSGEEPFSNGKKIAKDSRADSDIIHEMEQTFGEKENNYKKQISILNEQISVLGKDIASLEATLTEKHYSALENEKKLKYEYEQKLNQGKMEYEETVRVCEHKLKLKENYQNRYQEALQEKSKNEEQLKSQLRDFQNAFNAYQMEINNNKTKIEELHQTCQRYLEDKDLMKMQMDQYEQDFKVERDAREKQQGEIINQQELNEKLMKQIDSLKQELNVNAGNRMREQRFYMQQTEQGRYQQHQPVNYAQDYNRRPPAAPQQQHRQQHHYYGSGGNPQNLYGRGTSGEGGGASRPDHFYEEIEDVEEVQCPKCLQPQPDKDSLQVHLVDCLDN